MKKLLALILALTMLFALVACGEKKEEAPAADPAPAASAAETEGNVVEVPADQVEEEQAKADADYEQLKAFAAEIANNTDILADVGGPMTEAYTAGTITLEDLLTGYQEAADHAASMYVALQDAQWQTEYYTDHIAALDATLDSLASYTILSLEAASENDVDKYNEATVLAEEYNANLDQFLTLMGA